MEYSLITGVVTNLVVTAGYEDLCPFKNIQEIIEVAGMAATVLESASSSSLLANSRIDTEVKMEFFTCVINDKPLKGVFYKVNFKNGDEMEFVVKEIDGVYDVKGACDVNKNLIWTLPYQTRGHIAQKQSDLIGSLIGGILFGIFYSSLFGADIFGVGLTSCGWIIAAFLMGFVIAFVVSVLARRHFYDFSFSATKIFETFGFADPENINLPKNHRKAEQIFRQKHSDGEYSRAPWQFRYTTADTSDN